MPITLQKLPGAKDSLLRARQLPQGLFNLTDPNRVAVEQKGVLALIAIKNQIQQIQLRLLVTELALLPGRRRCLSPLQIGVLGNATGLLDRIHHRWQTT